jgi:hypothetical protein
MKISPEQQKEIDKAIAKRDAFLEDHPHLQEFQDNLDIEMAHLQPIDRCRILFVMITKLLAAQIEGFNELMTRLPRGGN